MDDTWETTYFGDLSQTSSGDFDSDGMTNGEEFDNGFDPTVDDGAQDADGDRYPNVFEVHNSSDPNDAASVPTPIYLVNPAGGGTHTTIAAAMRAATTANGQYQVIAIAPGTYTGNDNLRGVTVPYGKPKLLFIGLEGASKTIIDGQGANFGWYVQTSAFISSLTFRNTFGTAMYVSGSGIELHLNDLVFRDNVSRAVDWTSAALHVDHAVKTFVTGSSFINNIASIAVKQIYINSGTATFLNTVVSSSQSGTMLDRYSSATISTNYSFVKGQTLTGTGNLAGNIDPKLLPDGHLMVDSPLRAAGGAPTRSRMDLDGELRPSSAPDIGADQFIDTDADDIADQWEMKFAGNLTTITGGAQDADSDGLSNNQELSNETNPVVFDTDADDVSDGDEVLVYATNPLVADTDADEMPDGWEVAHGLSATTSNAFADDDGDRYPNIYEYARSSDPSDRTSIPTPNYLVDPTGGGTHTTIAAAMNAASTTNGQYQIIAIAPGTYTGNANLRGVTIPAGKPKLLFIGLEGASKTIIDGQNANFGWYVQTSASISSLTFRNTFGTAMYVSGFGVELHLNDLVFMDNVSRSVDWTSAALHVDSAVKTFVTGSSFINNIASIAVKQIYINSGAATFLNTVVWSSQSGTMLDRYSSATISTNYSFVKGQTLTGTGNLPGNTDPGIRSDGHLRSDSPLRAAGSPTTQSRLDMDGELRPSTAPDIGADQFNDADSDGLPDAYEVATFGDITTVSGFDDEDNDELDNSGEYDWETDREDPDTDRDGLYDGIEIALGMNPLVSDTDDLFGDLNHDGVIDNIGIQLGYQPHQMDDDGDSVSNADELLMCTDPLRSDSDGDGIPDGTDVFPLDPRISALSSNPSDTTPPVITLTAPWNAIEQ